MTCPTCGTPNHINCQCHLKYVYYKDENGINRHSAYKYPSLESFFEMCRKNHVNMEKIIEPQWGG